VNNILEKFHKMRIFTKKHISNEEKLLEKNTLPKISEHGEEPNLLQNHLRILRRKTIRNSVKRT